MASVEEIRFTLFAQGHPNIQATHSSTFEVTMEPRLSLRGDCIIGVNASHAARHVQTLLGDVLQHPDTKILTYLSDGEITEQVHGYGSLKHSLSAQTSMVWRTSDFVDERTIAIRCNKAAKDLDRNLIKSLKNPHTVLQVAIVVFPGVKRRSRTI